MDMTNGFRQVEISIGGKTIEGDKLMRGWVLSAALGGMILCGAAETGAVDVEMYKAMATETIQAALSGSMSDVDGLIEKQEKLIEMGVTTCREHVGMAKKDEKLMNLVMDNVDRMKGMTLEEMEEAWHEGGVLKANGIDFDSLDEMGAAVSVMDMVLHPATAYIALKQYKQTGDQGLLTVVKDELNEVLEHLDFVDEHMKKHEGMNMGGQKGMKME